MRIENKKFTTVIVYWMWCGSEEVFFKWAYRTTQSMNITICNKIDNNVIITYKDETKKEKREVIKEGEKFKVYENEFLKTMEKLNFKLKNE